MLSRYTIYTAFYGLMVHQRTSGFWDVTLGIDLALSGKAFESLGVLVKGCLWRIGDGTNIGVWSEP